jgi:hypothetical protein
MGVPIGTLAALNALAALAVAVCFCCFAKKAAAEAWASRALARRGGGMGIGLDVLPDKLLCIYKQGASERTRSFRSLSLFSLAGQSTATLAIVIAALFFLGINHGQTCNRMYLRKIFKTAKQACSIVIGESVSIATRGAPFFIGPSGASNNNSDSASVTIVISSSRGLTASTLSAFA